VSFADGELTRFYGSVTGDLVVPRRAGPSVRFTPTPAFATSSSIDWPNLGRPARGAEAPAGRFKGKR
jgi:hypothetical protein